VTARTWPPIPLTHEERVALLTLRLLILSGHFGPEASGMAGRILARVCPGTA
jgi:hypothetical protein